MNNRSRPMIEAFMATYHRHEHLSVHYPLLNIFEVFEVGITSIQMLCISHPTKERHDNDCKNTKTIVTDKSNLYILRIQHIKNPWFRSFCIRCYCRQMLFISLNISNFCYYRLKRTIIFKYE